MPHHGKNRPVPLPVSSLLPSHGTTPNVAAAIV
jgi:hypothetical protein